MTRSLNRSDLEEIEDFLNEFDTDDDGDADLLETDASIDTLITQLEASFETVTALTSPSGATVGDLRVHVQDLAVRLEQVATELAQINQKLQ